jgi:tetratricopeptide (TPR) repeat protein
VLAALYLRARELDQAEATAAMALDLAQRHRERSNEAWIYWVLGEVKVERRDHEAARGHFDAARALADELGMRPLQAHCLLGVGKMYGRLGDRLQACEHLTGAIKMYRDMDMQFWLEQAETELNQLG